MNRVLLCIMDGWGISKGSEKYDATFCNGEVIKSTTFVSGDVLPPTTVARTVAQTRTIATASRTLNVVLLKKLFIFIILQF